MTQKIANTPWICPNCNAHLLKDECDSVAEMLNNGHSSVELGCEECMHPLVAEITEFCAEGEVELTDIDEEDEEEW
jgi:hypothetical protein